MGITRRALLGSAAAAGVVAATPWPLRALAQSASAQDIATAWAKLAQDQLDTGKPSAVAYTVLQRNQAPLIRALGTLSKSTERLDADTHTIFEIGSTTKVFTAILLGLTVDPSFGVTLDTELGPFLRGLPEKVRNKKVEKLSFGELAQYASCMTTDPPGHDNPDYTLEDLARWLNGPDVLQHPCQPGKVYYYSNIAWGLLGYALAQVWKYPSWTELVRDQLTKPLGMPDTIRSGTQSEEQQQRTATGYDDQDHVAAPLLGASFLGGGGELVSTAADMATFIAVNIDPSRAPTPALRRAIQFAQGSLRTYKRGIPEGAKPPPRKLKAPISSGIGWFAGMTMDGRIGWTKNGGTQGFESFVGFIPSTGVGIFMVLNHQGFNPQPNGREDLGLEPLDDPG